jgi:P27 family predicted phage terminase small subunit
VKRVAGTKRRATTRPEPKTVLLKGRDGLSAPNHLDEMALAAWAQLRDDCAAVLDAADAAMLEAAAVALGRFRSARIVVNRDGLLVEGRFGQMVENPALKVERDAAMMLHRAMVELGIGPSARARFAGVGVEGLQVSGAFPELAATA